MPATATETPPADVAASTDHDDGPEPSVHETVIEPRKGWIAVDWGEMGRQRELLFFLVWRDIKVRYKQAVLGFAWAVLQPLTQIAIFTLLFGVGLNLAAKFGGGMNVPYPAFIFAALLPWQIFSRAMTEGGLSLVNQQHLLTKIYFPRLFVPTASVGGAVFDLLISLPVFAVMLAVYRFVPPWTAVLLPLLLIPTILLSAGMAYLLSALTVTYRDFRFIIQFMAQLWMWVSFVMFPVPENWLAKPKFQFLFYLNPMYGQIAAYRKALLGWNIGWDPRQYACSVAVSVAVFFVGIFYFRRTERRFADIA